MLTLLKKKLSFSPASLARQGSETLITTLGLCGFFIHVAFIALFVFLELSVLASLNVLSCMLWACVVWLATHDKHLLAVQLATGEVIVHAIIATALLGPNFGFHFYLWPISILIALNPDMKFRHSGCIAILPILVFGFLSTFISVDRSAEYTQTTVESIFFSNILVAGACMILGGMLVRLLVSSQSQILHARARTDVLTQLYNRRYMMEFLHITEANRRRNHIPYCVCICDLDHFKRINDSLGHHAGDEALISFADFLRHSVRQSDCVARWGGEEFMLVLTNTAGEAARDTVDTLLQSLRNDKRIVFENAQPLSMSVGISEAMGEMSVDELVKRADEALYQAKAQGRDRVVLNTDP